MFKIDTKFFFKFMKSVIMVKISFSIRNCSQSNYLKNTTTVKSYSQVAPNLLQFIFNSAPNIWSNFHQEIAKPNLNYFFAQNNRFSVEA